jgi:hypothetical protein
MKRSVQIQRESLQNHKNMALSVIIMLIMSMMLTGCSLVGLGVGAAIDARQPKEKPLPANGLDLIKPGTKLIVILDDSTEMRVGFMGIDRLSSLEYNQRYSDHLKKLEGGQTLPLPGEKITVSAVSSDVAGNLVGFDQRFEGSWKVPTIRLNIPGQGNEMVRKLAEVERVGTSRGDTLKSGDLSLLVRQGKIPSMSTIAVQQQSGPEYVPIDGVSVVWLENNSHAKETGFLVGLCIDAAIIGIMVITLHDLDLTGDWSL